MKHSLDSKSVPAAAPGTRLTVLSAVEMSYFPGLPTLPPAERDRSRVNRRNALPPPGGGGTRSLTAICPGAFVEFLASTAAGTRRSHEFGSHPRRQRSPSKSAELFYFLLSFMFTEIIQHEIEDRGTIKHT